MARSVFNKPEASALALERHLARVTGSDSAPMRLAALVLENSWKLVLSKPGGGRSYTRGGKQHIASAPGQPPAVDTGKLRQSIGHGTVGGVMRVGTGLVYALPLEYGYKYASHTLLPRPHARPALAAARKEMGEVVAGTLRSATRRHLGRTA